jgi:hypothetical protein
MISKGCLAIVYSVEIIWCVKMTSKGRFSHFCKWKSENNVKKITEEVMLAGLFFRFGRDLV